MSKSARPASPRRTVSPREEDVLSETEEGYRKIEHKADKYAKETLSKTTFGNLMSKGSSWVILLIYIAIAVIFAVEYYYNRTKFVGLTVPAIVSNSWVVGIVLAIFYLLYTFGFIAFYSVFNKFSRRTRWINMFLYIVIAILQIITLAMAFSAYNFQACFWLSIVTMIFMLIQFFFLYHVNIYCFIVSIPIIIIQAIMIWSFWELWRKN